MASTATGSARDIKDYSPAATCTPLYEPHDGHTRCDITGSLHFAHFVTFTGVILKFAARRRSRRMLLVRFLGTPMAPLPYSLYFALSFSRAAQRGSGTRRSQAHSRSLRF